MTKRNRKAIIDDGMNPELVNGADFDGFYGIPVIKKPKEIIIPKSIVPFSKLSKADTFEDAIATYEMDQEFSDLLIHPDDYIDDLKKHIFISLDCSLYRNAPYAAQITNVYRSRAIGCYYIGNKNTNIDMPYVIDLNGNIILGRRNGNGRDGLPTPHPTLIGGKDPQVQMAGIVHIHGGKIASYDNQSGHFKPNAKSMQVADEAFGKLPSILFKKKKG